ncbi:tetratricopeptide repeat protein [Catellatospora citrea]|uniref:Tetratricopeptide repeat protein n=1 Tax=Catellatospora citrea TaxID=53366 RepID=A0A8J3NYQ1_9ACTN|nr:tetratricopeptide repeat protein [Catellatospora citrea]RKE05617.1 NB-ARC domain-containing protein [Catellatospora citrea]GIF96971.1 hypothetical protein Cci01nite_20650 [Catellatospora citrea]
MKQAYDTDPPDPARAASLDELTAQLRLLKAWAGDPSLGVITTRINRVRADAGLPAHESTRKSTVAGYFSPGRKRLDEDLFTAIVAALHPASGYPARWRAALRAVRQESTTAALFVDIRDHLPEVGTLVGRQAELAQITGWAARPDPQHGTVVAIEGMAGVGKTSLALAAARHLPAAGQPAVHRLYVDLRGVDAERGPVDVTAVLGEFLRLLGVRGDGVPAGPQARAEAYRRITRRQPVLVVLDNAPDEASVTALLPAGPHSLTLVTSRRQLPGLHRRIQLTGLDPADAVTLLRTIAGPGRVDAEPAAAAQLARLCGHLPLALAVSGAQLREHPELSLADHAEHRQELGPADEVEASLALSVRGLPPAVAATWRLLGISAVAGFTPAAAAALADTDPDTARRHLAELRQANLLQDGDPQRLHDVVRAFADSQARRLDPPSRRRAARHRLFEHYRHAAAAAMDLLAPQDHHPRPAGPPPGGDVVHTSPAEALAWLDRERPHLVAIIRQAVETGEPEHAWQLCLCLWRYFFAGRYIEQWLLTHEIALGAARAAGARGIEGQLLVSLGSAQASAGRAEAAIELYTAAATALREVGDRSNEARAVANLGTALLRLSRFAPARTRYLEAIDLFRELGDDAGLALQLGNLGGVAGICGDHPRAAAAFEESLAICRVVGAGYGEIRALIGLGSARRELGDQTGARQYLHAALQLSEAQGLRNEQAEALVELARLRVREGDPDEAVELSTQALDIARALGDPNLLGTASTWAAAAHCATGRPDVSVALLRDAIRLGTETANRLLVAYAYRELCRAATLTGDEAEADRCQDRARELSVELGVPVPWPSPAERCSDVRT